MGRRIFITRNMHSFINLNSKKRVSKEIEHLLIIALDLLNKQPEVYEECKFVCKTARPINIPKELAERVEKTKPENMPLSKHINNLIQTLLYNTHLVYQD
mgnify:CR=1 FL=1